MVVGRRARVLVLAGDVVVLEWAMELMMMVIPGPQERLHYPLTDSPTQP